MLLLVTGPSCSGKTTAASSCADLSRLAAHDSDERGLPSGGHRLAPARAGLVGARGAAARGERHGPATGQSPIGELLAVPETAGLPVADTTARLREWIGRSRGAVSA